MSGASPDRQVLEHFLRRGVARTRWLAAIVGGACGIGVSALALAFGVARASFLNTGVLTISMAVVGAVLAVVSVRATRRDVAARLERRTPASRNLLLTAAEIMDGTTRAAPHIETRVLHDAAALATRVEMARALPSRSTVIAAVTGVAVWILSLLSPHEGIRAAMTSATHRAPAIRTLTITVTPPAYSGRPAEALSDPDRLVALAGSRLDVVISADASVVAATSLGGTQELRASADGLFTTSLVADADGFLAVEPRLDADAGARRLVAISVTPDRAPTVKITAPGRDMIVPSGPRTLDIALEAADDIGLKTLALHYTKISGSGENFEFKSGEVPVTVARTDARSWTAKTSWALTPLALEPGDMLVYRGAVTDGRPGAPVTESDAFILEIAAPGALPSEGFAIDDRQDKYAISQQMVIVKTERLLAARKSMSANDFQEAVLDLAAEQRQVRAEFVFMMGGELADAGLDMTTLNEEAEAEGEDDLAAGRLANQGRADLLRAIRSMSRAAARLADADATGALPIEKEALASLQRAFARNRYLLRTLSERERLDLSRRLSGVLADLARDHRPAEEAPPNPHVAAARQALTDLAALVGAQTREGRVDAGRATAIAERVIAIDPSSQILKDVAAAIAALDLDRAALGVAAFMRASSPAEPARSRSAALDALAGALADELRRKAGGR